MELDALRAEVTDLRAAMGSRATIDQARGMLMQRFDLDAASAFALLKRVSQDNNVKVRDLANALVDPTLRGQTRRESSGPPSGRTARTLATRLLAGDVRGTAAPVRPFTSDPRLAGEDDAS